MSKLVECVPNFSDGRRPQVYNAIANAIKAVSGTRLLGISPDKDHNRTVITFIGPPPAVAEAAFQAVATAAKLIDMDEHEGEHPRIGATDVCPFVPVQNVTIAECVELANQVGQRVGEELEIPVYLYGEAATRPERKLLSRIRKGQYEAWKTEIGVNPRRQPDFGPAAAKSTGATVIGARPFLIAYNIYLNSDRVEIAKKIAATVRHSSGGLRFVQAMGVMVDGQAQVSMNLTNFEKTAIPQAQEMVKREAGRYGLRVTKAELVGLTPQQALLDAATYYLQLDDFDNDQVLEIKAAAEAKYDSENAGIQPPKEFVEAVAGKSATPGGGSVGALAGALGAALTQMMAGLTIGRKKYADVSDQAQEISDKAEELRLSLTQAVSDDIAAFDAFMAVVRDKSLTGDARSDAMQQATVRAGEVPLQMMRDCLQVAELTKQIVAIGNLNAISDGACGAIMARAAAQAAGFNVKINAHGLDDQALADAWRSEVDELNAQISLAADEAIQITIERGNLG